MLRSSIPIFSDFGLHTQYSTTSDLPGGSNDKESACNAGELGLTMSWEDPLEKGMVTQFSTLAWRIPWTEEPGRLHTVHGVTKSWKYWVTNSFTVTGQRKTHLWIKSYVWKSRHSLWHCSNYSILKMTKHHPREVTWLTQFHQLVTARVKRRIQACKFPA